MSEEFPIYSKKSKKKPRKDKKVAAKLFSVGQVAQVVGVAGHTIRFWQQNFPSIKYKIGNGKRKYYNQEAVDKFVWIKNLMYNKGIKIAGIQQIISDPKLQSAGGSAFTIVAGATTDQVSDLFGWAGPETPSLSDGTGNTISVHVAEIMSILHKIV